MKQVKKAGSLLLVLERDRAAVEGRALFIRETFRPPRVK